jgi:hypothetical protein
MQINLGVGSLLGIVLWVIFTAFVFLDSLSAHGGTFTIAALMAIYLPGIDLIIIAFRFIWTSQSSSSKAYGQQLIALAIVVKIYAPGLFERLMQGLYLQQYFAGWVWFLLWFLLIGIVIIKKPFLARTGSGGNAP